jgi:hypothetical protein
MTLGRIVRDREWWKNRTDDDDTEFVGVMGTTGDGYEILFSPNQEEADLIVRTTSTKNPTRIRTIQLGFQTLVSARYATVEEMKKKSFIR